jgi:polysaccharide export outer membrane protein
LIRQAKKSRFAQSQQLMMKSIIASATRFLNTDRKPIRALTLALALILGAAGCQTPPQPDFQPLDAKGKPVPPTTALLKEGDVLRIEFPSAPNLNAVKKIADGKIDLYLMGEVVAAGKTVNDLQKELVKFYKSQVLSSVVNITIESSSYSVFVSGAVLRPGEIVCEKPMTAAEAILKTGVDFSKANLKKVRVTRTMNGHYENHVLNLDRVLHGEGDSQPYFLKPSDSVYVPEKFQWF